MMGYYRLGRGLTHSIEFGKRWPGIGKALNTVFLTLCSTLLILFIIGCGESDQKNLVSARSLIQKYKGGEDIAGIKSELDIAVKEDSGNPEALCPLKALEIVKSGATAETQEKAVEEIIALVRSVENEIKKLEAIDKDLLKDEDKENLKKLSRKWNLSMEPAVVILKSETGWISNVGRPAIDLLIEALKVSNPMVQNDVAKLLVSFKDISFDALTEALQNESSMVRRQALKTLGRIGDERSVEPITSLLDDEDPGVRFYVPVELDIIGGEKAIESLHKALRNDMASVRMSTADILGRIEDETAIDLLIERLADDDSYVKTSANNALLRIGAPAVPKLIEVLENRAEGISLPATSFIGDKIGNYYEKELSNRTALQGLVAAILGNMNDPRAINPLLNAMQRQADAGATDAEKGFAASVRASSAAALGTMGPAAVEPLIDLLENSKDENIRISAASILGTIGDKRAVLPLISALKNNSKAIRGSSAAALGLFKDRRAVLPLIETLKDDDVVTRTNAATSLSTMLDKRAAKPLIDVVENKIERERIRDEAIKSLGMIKDTSALEPLLKIVINEYEKDGIRKSAMNALRTMENPWPSEALIGLLKGEIISGVFAPKKGIVSSWLKNENDGDLIRNLTPLVEISTGTDKEEVKASDSGMLVKIYVEQGKEVEADALLGIIAYEDRDIKQEERSSIRSAAALALGKVIGDNAVPALTESLRKDKSAAVRKNAATALREIASGDARAALIGALKHDDRGVVRSEAAFALGVIKGSDSVPPLIDALREDKYESTRVKAAWSLGEIVDKRAVKPLVDLIVKGRNDEQEASTVIAEAITALDKLGGNGIEPLVEVLKDKSLDDVPRSRAARVLGLIASANAMDPLLEALKDESVVVRSEAAKSLGLLGNRKPVEPLLNLLGDGNEWITVRANAAQSLGNIRDERAVVPLIDALNLGIAAIRSNAVVALGALKDTRATMPLIQILRDEKEDDAVRVSAIAALSSIADPSSVDALMEALESSSGAIREAAASAMGSLSVGAAVPSLIKITGDMGQSATLRSNAAASLGSIGDKRAVAVLTERVGDENESDAVWIKIADAAGKVGISQVPSLVKERTRDVWESAAVRSAAMMSAVLTDGDEDFSTSLEMLGDATVAIRSGAALALGASGRKEAVQPLIDKMQNDAEEVVRRDSAKALGSLADPSSEQALIKALNEDAKASVKIASAAGLGNINGRDGIAALIKAFQDTAVASSIRSSIATALGSAKSSEAVSALKAELDNDTAVIHYEVAEALRKITGEKFGYER